MAAITATQIKGPFEAIAADGADFTLTAGAVSGDTIACNGRDVIIAFNSGASPYTVTITSQADEKGRTKDITTYSLAAGDYAVFGVGLTNSAGWKDANGNINVTVSNVAVKWAVLRLPATNP